MRKINFLLSLIFLTLVSCVGTIEDTSTPDTQAEGGTMVPAAYKGIVGAKAISDTRVEVYFPPAPGNQENYIYQIYKDKAELPIEVRFSALSTNYDGFLTYTYTDLEPSTTYSFSVEFKDLISGNGSRSTNGTINATTLSNQMCDFDGIVDARAANGLAALNTINVYWFPARDSGFVISSEDYDPVKYEIIGISEAEGGLEKIEDINANRIVIPIDPNKSFHAVGGLEEGTKYFFQVRCKHEGWKNKGYIDFQETIIGTYRRETNTKYIEISTKSSGNDPEFEKPFEIINPLVPSDAESNLGVQWQDASGGFAEYRIFYRKMNPGAPIGPGEYDEDSIMQEDASSIDDDFMNAVLDGTKAECLTRNNLCGSIKVVSEENSGNIDGLDKFAFYQVLVVACINSDCDTDNRIRGKATQRFGTDFALGRVIPNIIPFNGITDIENPNPAVDPTIIKLNFASPLRDSGYATRLVVRCFQGVDDSSPAIFPTVTSSAVGDRDPIVAPGKAECDGLSLRTVLPDHSGMLGFTEIEIDGIEVNTNRNYCFSVHPVIDESSGGLDYFYNDEDNAIIQCITPEVVGPTLQEFAGRRVDRCEFDDSDPANLKMTVKWFTPTGGYWTNFRIFWKEFDPDSSNPDIAGPLNFQKAIDGDADYSTANAVLDSDKEYTITGLSPGKKYHIGVLPFFVLGTDRFGEFNTATRECEVPYPEVEFNEWTNVLAIGPKVDGRIPETIDGTTKDWTTTRLFESLDEYGVPTETQLDGSTLVPTDTALRGNTIFNGVFGQENGDSTATEPPHRYSNSGIIRIEFKDILVDHKAADPSWYDNYQTFHDFREYLIANEPGTYARNQEGWNDGVDDGVDEPANKKDRKIGYKILRSDDNKQTWIDLTQKHSTKNPFQKDDNEGLVYSELVTYFKVNGRYRTENERRVVFTDYSVKHFEDNGVTSRGRVYWYKVVPVVNGRELKYKDEESNPHHMIRVVLPPPNMSFVSRMMVNRQACIELGKEDEIRKGDGQFYSCPYNGVGARGLETPWNTSATYYDMGGDLLVDRYELGCDWTRGDMLPGSPASSTTDADASDEDVMFEKYKDYTEAGGLNGNQPGKGCFQLGAQDEGDATDWNNSEPTNFAVDPALTLSHKKAIPGDCFGSGERILYPGFYDRCYTDETAGRTPSGISVNYPGAFRNDFDFIVDGGGNCQYAMTLDSHNAEPSMPYDNDTLHETTDTHSNMDPYQAQSEYAAVFYMRSEDRNSGGGHSVRTLRKYFSSNDSNAIPPENQFLSTVDRSRPSSCFINLYGRRNPGASNASSVAGHSTNVRPRWLSLDEVLGSMSVREIAWNANGKAVTGPIVAGSTIDDLYKQTLGYITNQSNTDLYGGDWLPPAHIQGIIDGRMDNDLPIARIMTSNASKLPQIESLNQDEYQKLCQLYEVEVGYANISNDFIRSYPEPGKPSVKKRLPRRSEFVAFSTWSDRYGEATVITLEKGDSDTTLTDILAALANTDATETGTNIDPTDIQAGTFNGYTEQEIIDRLDNWEPMACNTEVKHADAAHRGANFYNIDISDTTTANRFKDLHPTFPMASSSDNPHYWSGSSRLDNTSYNSERCVSRYGIQDHIGNLREMGADQFWCDPAAHELTLVDGGNSINMADKGYMWFRESTFPTWADQIGNTGVPFGECSMRGRGNNLAAFPALSGTNMVSIYEDYTRSTYNETGLLPKVNTIDPEAVLTVRNGGDGEFLSFGATSISPSLYTNVVGENRLTLQDAAESDGGYFSPVLGLPIRCPGISCDNSADNKLVTNPIFHNNLKTTEFGDVIDDDKNCVDHLPGGSNPKAGYPITNCDFPLGNSDIENYSTHEYEIDRDILYTNADPRFVSNNYSRGATVDFAVGAGAGGNPILASATGTIGLPTDSITVDGVIDRDEQDAWINAVDAGELTGGVSLELIRISPKDDGSPGVFINGGGASSTTDLPGRYALDIDMDRFHYIRKYKNTARCVVKIHGADY